MQPALTPNPAIALLEKIGMRVRDVNKSVAEHLRAQLLQRVAAAQPAQLKPLLLQLPRYLAAAELRAIPVAVIRRFEREREPLPSEFLAQLKGLPADVVAQLPLYAKRQLWKESPESIAPELALQVLENAKHQAVVPSVNTHSTLISSCDKSAQPERA